MLRLKVALSMKPWRAAEPALFVLGHGASGRLRCARMQLPADSSAVEMFDCLTCEPRCVAQYRGISPLAACIPTFRAALMPWFGVQMQRKGNRRTIPSVASRDPSLTTITSKSVYRSFKPGLVINGHVYCANTTSQDPGRLGRHPSAVYRGLPEIRNNFTKTNVERAFGNLNLIGRRVHLSPPIHTRFLRGPV